MTLKNDEKPEEELASRLKIDDSKTQKSQKFTL